MMKRLLVVLALMAIAEASPVMPLISEASEVGRAAGKEAPAAAKEICAPQTPCQWSVYKAQSRIVELDIKNTYCDCGSDTECTLSEDDQSTMTYVYKCRPPSHGTDSDETL